MARRPRLLSPTVLLRRNALHKGLFGGSRGWLAVGAALWAPRVVKRVLGRNEEVVTIEKLKPGQFVRVDAVRPPTRRERKSARRAS
jgi:hypothetical protein